MGLRRITGQQFPISPEEWQKRELRRHDIKQWTITIIQIIGIVLLVIGSIKLIEWLEVV